MTNLKQEIEKISRGYRLIYEIDRVYLFLNIINAFTDALMPFINLYMSSLIITEISTTRRLHELWIYVAVTVTSNLLLSLLKQWIQTLKSKHSELFESNMALYYSDVNNRMQYGYIENPETQFKRNRINQNANYSGAGFPQLIASLGDLVKNIFSIFLSLTLTVSMFYLYSDESYTGILGFINSPYSILLVVGIIIFNTVLSIICDKNQKLRSSEAWKDLPKQNRLLNYYNSRIWNYNGGMDIRIFNQAKLIQDELTKYYDNPAHLKQLVKIRQYYGVIRVIVNAIINILIYCYIGIKVFIGVFGVGNFIMYTGTIKQFTMSVSGLCVCIASLFNNNKYLQEIFEYIDIPNMQNKGVCRIERGMTIEFHNVSFKYPGTDIYALKDVNIKITRGKRIAVVGMNGSGKSTMIKLLCRLYEPTEGEITLDGVEIRQYDYNEYLKLFSVVFQDFNLFAFSLGQNVSTSIEYDGKKALECLEMAGFDDKLLTLPHGLETPLYKYFEEDGIEMSGGEAQKIALARALYKDSPFIVLDEPTAALDPIAEAEIYMRFNQIIKNRSVVFISHRLSSCRFCDEIIVFDAGNVVQHGNHDELVRETKGKYYELWNAQAQYYT